MKNLEREAIENIEDLLSEWQIKFGVPMRYPEEVRNGENLHLVGVPLKPHIFYTKTLRLEQKSNRIAAIQNAFVMLAHGVAEDNEDKGWKILGTGKSISETTEAYEKVAKQFFYLH